MTPEITEFSYGFALTNEIVGWAPLTAAPLFPSLIEEGKAGGGYDVKLDLPGVPLYLQFKRADCMVRSSAREISLHNLPLSLPFYRFKITQTSKSDQHDLLLALDTGSNFVFYAAPRFHERTEINIFWNSNQVATQSIFISPNCIGQLNSESHHVSYDSRRAWVCSDDPKEVEFLDSISLIEKLTGSLKSDSRPMRDKISELLEHIHAAEHKAEAQAAERRGELPEILSVEKDVPPRVPPTTPSIATRSPRPLTEDERQLRELSDTAARVFDAQLIIVQPA